MITISSGLKNSLIVLEHLRYNQEATLNFDVSVGTFTNCRECGLTFALLGVKDDEGNDIFLRSDDIFTYCVYEHRNSDEIIINGKKGYVSMNGDLPYNGDSKYTYLASFPYNQHFECAQRLIEMMEEIRQAVIIKYKKEKAAL